MISRRLSEDAWFSSQQGSFSSGARSCLDPLAAVGAAVGALRAPVVLDVLRPGGRDLDALAVVPLLAVVAADPELVLAVVGAAGPAQGVVMLLLLVIALVLAALLLVLGGWHLRLCTGLSGSRELQPASKHKQEWISGDSTTPIMAAEKKALLHLPLSYWACCSCYCCWESFPLTASWRFLSLPRI